jgi:hypothetical protein
MVYHLLPNQYTGTSFKAAETQDDAGTVLGDFNALLFSSSADLYGLVV